MGEEKMRLLDRYENGSKRVELWDTGYYFSVVTTDLERNETTISQQIHDIRSAIREFKKAVRKAKAKSRPK